MNLKQRIDDFAARVEGAGLLDDVCRHCEPRRRRQLGSLVVRSIEEVQTCPECGGPVGHDGKALGSSTNVVVVHGRPGV